MKKALMLICVCLVILSAFSPVCVSSASLEEDALHISDEILDRLPLKAGDQVVRVYNIHIVLHFGKNSNIEELMNDSKNYVQVVYVVQSPDGSRECYSFYDNECVKMFPDSSYYFYRLLDTVLAGDVIKQIDPDIQVEHAYYFSGETNMVGSAIYYKTNLGDYVYYECDGKPIQGTFLFSAEAFFALQKTYYESLRAYDGNAPVGGGSIAEMDLSAYEIGSPNFNPNAPFPVQAEAGNGGTLWLIGGIALAVVLTATAAWFFLYRRKNTANPIDPISE